MKRSEFAEKIMGIKLGKYQKEYFDKELTERQKFAMGRRTGDRGLYYAIIDHFYELDSAQNNKMKEGKQ